MFFLQVPQGLLLAQSRLPPLLSLKPSPGSLEDPPLPRTNHGCLGPHPKHLQHLSLQAHSPTSPTTTSTFLVSLVGERTEESVVLDLVIGVLIFAYRNKQIRINGFLQTKCTLIFLVLKMFYHKFLCALLQYRPKAEGEGG